MDISKQPKRRRARGSGSVYRKGRVWWIAYYGPDGRRHAESSESTRKGDAERLLYSAVSVGSGRRRGESWTLGEVWRG